MCNFYENNAKNKGNFIVRVLFIVYVEFIHCLKI